MDSNEPQGEYRYSSEASMSGSYLEADVYADRFYTVHMHRRELSRYMLDGTDACRKPVSKQCQYVALMTGI